MATRRGDASDGRRTRSTPGRFAYWWGEGSAPCTLLTRAGSFAVRSRLELDLWSAMVENTVAAQDHFAAFMEGAHQASRWC